MPDQVGTRLGDPQWCLYEGPDYRMCYASPVAIVQRSRNGFYVPVCAEHVELGQKAVHGPTEVVPLAEWLARPRLSQAELGWAGS